jgi:hypothetical protein
LTHSEDGLNPTVPPTRPAAEFRKRRSRLPLIAFPVLFVIAFLSLKFSDTSATGDVERIYRSIGIFTGNGSWAFDPHAKTTLLFRIMAIMAPLLTALGVTELATGATGPLLVRLRGWFRRLGSAASTVVIFGLTESSLDFARALDASGRYLPLVVAREQDQRLAGRAARHWIPVVPTTMPWWQQGWTWFAQLIGVPSPGGRVADAIVLPRGVTEVVSFLPTPGEQVDLAAKLTRRVDRTGRAETLRARLLVADRGLAQRLDDYLKYAHNNAGVFPRLIDLDALAARLLLTTHPLDMLADAFDQTQIHLAIYGFGALGRAVAKEAVRLYVTRASLANVNIRITAIDRDPEAIRAFSAEDPEIDQILDFVPQPGITMARAGLTAQDVARLIPSDVTAHVICFGDTQAAFALAVSLRRWLLEPPRAQDEAWRQQHRAAPIFMRAEDWTGLGRLVRSGVDYLQPAAAEVPDGIFGFGTRETLFSPETLLAPQRERAAAIAHGVYSTAVQAMPAEGRDLASRRGAGQALEDLPPPLLNSNLHVVDHVPIKARAVGYRLDRRRTPGVWPPADPAMLRDLSHLEHRRYLAERSANGWRYAPVRRDEIRVHPDLLPWDRLPPVEQTLDTKLVEALPQIAAATGKRLAEALVIGVAGHRPEPGGIDARHVYEGLKARLDALLRAHSDRALVLLTTLAPGTESWAAQAAWRLRIPFIVPLPLPFEIYQEDFAEGEERSQFHALIARAEYYIELPLRFGSVSELTKGRRNPPPPDNVERRAKQYALAGGYIVERSHVMLGLSDGQPAGGLGGAADMLSWTPQTVPPEYRTRALFRPPLPAQQQIRIAPRPAETGSRPANPAPEASPIT